MKETYKRSEQAARYIYRQLGGHVDNLTDDGIQTVRLAPEAQIRQLLQEHRAESSEEGFTMIPNGLIRDPKIGPAAKAILNCHVSHAWGKGHSLLGQAKLSEYTGVCERTIRKATRELEELGIITTVPRGRDKSHKTVLNFSLPGKTRTKSKGKSDW
jgi:hypothetical protein